MRGGLADTLSPGLTIRGVGMDVGFLCQGWHPDAGGIERHARDLAVELRARGHRVHVLALDYAEGREPYSVSTEEREGVSVRRMAYRYHDHTALSDLVRNDRAEDVVLAWLAETPCDVVHVHHLTGWGAGALRAVHEVGQPLVATLHDYWLLCPRGQMLRADGSLAEAPDAERCAECIARTWPHLLPSGGGDPEGPSGEPVEGDAAAAAARTAFALECLALPARILAPSETARRVYGRAGFDEARIEVCENGIDAEGIAAAVERARAERPRAADGALHLGVIGSVLPSKGVLELARALARADAPGLVLDVHGALPAYHGAASYADALRALAAEDAHVRLHGPFAPEELAGVLAGLDGVAAPSRWEEVYGLSVREARAAGLPVLVSDAGDLPRVADEGRAGLVVPRDDGEGWSAALRRFARDGEARAAWAAHRSRIRTRGEMALQVERAYVEAVREVTGQAPELAAAAAGEEEPPEGPPRERKGLLRRLLGRSRTGE